MNVIAEIEVANMLARVRQRPAIATMPKSPLKNVPLLDEVYMGIDPSLTSTGVSLIYRGGIHAFTLVPPKDCAKGTDRLVWFFDQFTSIFNKYNPHFVAIEGYSFGSKGAVFNIGEHGGVLRLALKLSNRRWIVVPPQTLKKFATGSGAADKESVSKELFKRFSVDLYQNDTVDAAGLALYAMAHHSSADAMALTAVQLTTLTKADITNA